jgi:hypothetical protein
MTKTIIAALALAALTGAASAQSRTFYDSTNSSGTVTNYDGRGRVASAPEDLRRQQNTHRIAERGQWIGCLLLLNDRCLPSGLQS